MSVLSLRVAVLALAAAAVPPIILGSARVTLWPGKRARVVTKLVSPVPHAEGPYHAHTGRVVVSVKVGDKPWVDTDLSALIGRSEMGFMDDSVELVFADYNRDGQLDFNLGQQCGSNNFCYWLFTIEPSGRVSLLPLLPIDRSPGFLWLGDSASSTLEIPLTSDGIESSGYDPACGGFRQRYRWDVSRKAFILTETRYAEPGRCAP